jgi:hypothetical protein
VFSFGKSREFQRDKCKLQQTIFRPDASHILWQLSNKQDNEIMFDAMKYTEVRFKTWDTGYDHLPKIHSNKYLINYNATPDVMVIPRFGITYLKQL